MDRVLHGDAVYETDTVPHEVGDGDSVADVEDDSLSVPLTLSDPDDV